MHRFTSIAATCLVLALLSACGDDEGGGTITPPPGDASYHWMNPASQGAHLFSVWGPSADNLFATGSGGVVMRYDGDAWRLTRAPVSANLNGIWGADATHVFAVGQDGVILFFNGSSWTQQASPTTQPLNDIWGTSATDVYAVGQQREVIHYDGVSWDTMSVAPGIDPLRSVWGSSSNDIYVTGLGTTLLHYNGSSWGEVETGSSFALNAVWGTDSLDVFAVGGNGAAVHYDGTWNNINIGEALFPLTVWGSSSTDVYAMGFASGAASAAYHWNGFSWSPVDVNSSKGINRVFGVDNRVFAVGSAGLIHEQSGNEFIAMTGGRTTDLHAVWVSPTGSEAFAVGELGTILHFEAGAWTPMSSGTTTRLRGLGATCSCNILAVGENGTVLRYNGVDWSDVSPGAAVNFNGAWMDDSGTAFVVGSNATVMRYENGGWEPLSLGSVTDELLAVWGPSLSDVYVVGNNTASYRWTGTQFKHIVVSPLNTFKFNSVYGTSADDVYIGATLQSAPPPAPVHGGGSIFHWDGEAWAPIFSDPISEVLSVWRNGQQGFGTGDSGMLLRDPQGNTGFTRVFDVENLPYYVNSVWGSSLQNVFVVGNDGAIVRYSP